MVWVCAGGFDEEAEEDGAGLIKLRLGLVAEETALEGTAEELEGDLGLEGERRLSGAVWPSQGGTIGTTRDVSGDMELNDRDKPNGESPKAIHPLGMLGVFKGVSVKEFEQESFWVAGVAQESGVGRVLLPFCTRAS